MNENITLYFTQGSSDKVYQAQLKKSESGFLVNFQYGARGKSLRTGTKTANPIPYEKAKPIYDKLVASKTSKGYTPMESGVTYAGTEKAGDKTNFQPQLLTPTSENDIEDVLKSFGGKIGLQTKHDGERRGVIASKEIVGANRTGLQVGLPETITQDIDALISSGYSALDFDSEDMGDHLVIFDILTVKEDSLTSLSFEERTAHLQDLAQAINDLNLKTLKVDLPVWCTSKEEVLSFLAAAKQSNEEGIVLRNPKAPYSAGRPTTGGDVQKIKFMESATVRVQNITKGKRSIGMEILGGNEWVNVGKCTIPANYDIPDVGALVEVKYLYAYREGALYQPIYKGLRTDLQGKDAHIKQLKYKK